MRTLYIIAIIIIVIIITLVVIFTSSDNTSTDVKAPRKIYIEVSNGKINSEWENVAQTNYYTLYYSDKPFTNKEEAKILTPLKEPKIEMSCIPPGTYHFQVTATKITKNKFGIKVPVESEPSPLESIVIKECQPLPAPQAFDATIKDDKIVLSWDWIPMANSYKLKVLNVEGRNIISEIEVPQEVSKTIMYKIPLSNYAGKRIGVAAVSNCIGEYSEITLPEYDDNKK